MTSPLNEMTLNEMTDSQRDDRHVFHNEMTRIEPPRNEMTDICSVRRTPSGLPDAS